jgi:hypothetical protein
MRKSYTAAIAALAIVAGGSWAASLPALADNLTVQVNPGGIAFGYSDGYWDQGHQWHAWRDAQEAARYRDEHRDHHYEWKHDRDADKGWHDKDTWWHR